MRTMLALWAVVMGVSLIATAAEKAKPIFSDDFETNPIARGWTVPDPMNWDNEPAWIDTEAHGGKHCIYSPDGFWNSPAFPVTPFAYYKLHFYSKAKGKAYWAMFAYNAKSEVLFADHYSSFDPSEEWVENTFVFHGKANATQARVTLRNIAKQPFWIDDLSVTPITPAEAAGWVDTVAAGMPANNFVADPNRWQCMPKTIARLQQGGKLRIVMLGDSIINDTGNSQWGALLQRLYPKAKIEVITSVRGGTGCTYYKDENRVQKYVFDYQPDFVIIGGISNGAAESIRTVIQQIRAKYPDMEILLTSGCISQRGYDPATVKDVKVTYDPNDPKDYRGQQAKIAAEERVEFLDMAGPWIQYVLEAKQPYEWYNRDPVHANARAGAVVGRILERFFAPKP